MNKGFVITIPTVILLFLGVTAVAFGTGTVAFDDQGNFQIRGNTIGGPNYVTNEEFQQFVSEGNIPENTRVDLRDVAQPALDQFPNVPGLCTIAGGTWHWADNWVGCEITGFPEVFSNCDAEEALLGAQQCEALGATATCNENEGVYCKY